MRKILTSIVVLAMVAAIAISGGSATAAITPTNPQDIGGSIFTGDSSVRYLFDLASPLGEPVAVYDNCVRSAPADSVLSPSGAPLTLFDGTSDPGPSGAGLDGTAVCPALSGAKVLIQDQDTGEPIGYGVVAENSWTATVDADVHPSVVATFSAPGHDVTSREFNWDPVKLAYTHSIPGITDALGTTGVNVGGNLQDAHLPPLLNVDPVTGTGDLPSANLLHYAFYDEFVNGADDGTLIDPGLNCVTVRAYDDSGNLLQTRQTGERDFTTKDGVVFGAGGIPAEGYVYFEGLPPGEIIVESDPSSITSACNPGILHLPDLDPITNLARTWSATFTEEGGTAWDLPLAPGDPGTEAGAYMTWHGFIEEIGNDAGGNPVISNSIKGTLLDADGNDPAEPFPGQVGGRVNGHYPNGADVERNARITNGRVALYEIGDFPKLVATTHATQPTGQNDQNGGEFNFINVPPGKYEIFAYDSPLYNVPLIGTGLTVSPGPAINLGLLMPRFGARGQGTVMNGTTPVPNARVLAHYESGAVKHEATTDSLGYFNFEFLPEIETMGYVSVEMPDGSEWRGKIITEEFDPDAVDLLTGMPINNGETTFATHNSMNRYVAWMTFNYWVDIQVEDVPAATGDIHGAVFYDNLEQGSWSPDGIYDDSVERTLHGVTVELYDAADAGPAAIPLASTTTGIFDTADTVMQGWQLPSTLPLNEIGGVFAGPVYNGVDPVAPTIGMYDFRDQPPGDYVVKVVPPVGYEYSPSATSQSGGEFATIAGGASARVDIGASTTPSPDQSLYFSLDCGPLGNASTCAEDLDILRINTDNSTTVVFDGSNVTTAIGTKVWLDPFHAQIDGFSFLSESEILISFQRPQNRKVFGLPPGPAVDDSDVLLFTADSLGEGTTSGVWSRYFDGSDVGLDAWGEDIDAIAVLPDGGLLMSTVADAVVAAGTFPDEDVFRFDFGVGGPGTNTAGTFSPYFDGSATGAYTNELTNGGEDIDAFALDSSNGDVHLSTLANFAVGNRPWKAAPWTGGTRGQDDDIATCTPTTPLTAPLTCSGWALTLDGAAIGLDPAYDIKGLDLSTSVVGPREFGVPRAGFAEGGVFDDTGPLDIRLGSLLAWEKAGIVGAPVGVYDHHGYLLGVMFMGDPMCHPTATAADCPAGNNQDPVAQGRFASGVHRYLGNDNGFCEDRNGDGVLQVGEDVNGNGNLDCFQSTFDPMELAYAFGQGGNKFEADWSLVPPLIPAVTVDICVTDMIVANTGPADPWTAVVSVTVSEEDGAQGMPVTAGPVSVFGTWSNGEGATADTVNGIATLSTPVPPDFLSDVFFTVDTVTGPAFYVYNPANTTIVTCIAPAVSDIVPNPNSGTGGGLPLQVSAGSIDKGEGKWFVELTIVGEPDAEVTYMFEDGEQKTKTLADGSLVVKSETIEDPGVASIGYSVGDGTTTVSDIALKPS